MRTLNLNETATTLETLLDKISDFLREDAKRAAGVTCYNNPGKITGTTPDLYDGILADTTNTKTHVIEVFHEWNMAVGKFSQLIHHADFTPQERTVLILKYLDGKSANEIMAETGYPDTNRLINNAESKTAKITDIILRLPENPIKAFLEDILPVVSIDAIPWGLLQDMYQGWGMIFFPGIPLEHSNNRNCFIHEVRMVLDSSPHGWDYTVPDKEKTKTKKTLHRICQKSNIYCEEPLLDKFGCVSWMKDPQKDRLHLKKINRLIRGLYRI